MKTTDLLNKCANDVISGLIKEANSRASFMGIDTRPFMERDANAQAAWSVDLQTLVREWWSSTRVQMKTSRNATRFEFEFAGRPHSIIVKGDPSRRVEVDVNGTGTSFKPMDSLYDIVLWMDSRVMNRGRLAQGKVASWKSDLEAYLADPYDVSRADLIDKGYRMFTTAAQQMGYTRSNYLRMFMREAVFLKKNGFKATVADAERYMRIARDDQEARFNRHMRMGLFLYFVGRAILTSWGVDTRPLTPRGGFV